MHVPVTDVASPLANPDGSRAETKASCDGSQQRVRPAADLHLTRFGAGRAGSTLAEFVAARLHVDLHDDDAPGDRAAALVPRSDGRGYWLVGCDGSVYRFGRAPRLPGARAELAGHGGVVGAVRTPDGEGLWLVAADGTVASVGGAPRLAFTRRPVAPVTGVTGVPGAVGLWATTASGEVLDAGAARDFGELSDPPASLVTGIAAAPDARGYLLVTAGGEVLAFGSAPAATTTASDDAGSPVVGITATTDGSGYWLVDADGRVRAFGDAVFRGSARWHPPAGPYGAIAPPPGPAAGIVTRPGSGAGYWVFGTTGRVVARGTAADYGGDNSLALFTQ